MQRHKWRTYLLDCNTNDRPRVIERHNIINNRNDMHIKELILGMIGRVSQISLWLSGLDLVRYWWILG